MTREYVPAGFHTVTPFLTVDSPEDLLLFLLATFDAREVARTSLPDGRIRHIQILLEESMIEISAARDGIPALTSAVHVFVPNVRETFDKALASGARAMFEPQQMPWGEYAAAVADRSGTRWYLGHYELQTQHSPQQP